MSFFCRGTGNRRGTYPEIFYYIFVRMGEPFLSDVTDIQQGLRQFQEGYAARDASKLEAFMELFVPGDEAELIGIGASAPNQHEWFRGREKIREIIQSDWKYWGEVKLETGTATITIREAWHGYPRRGRFFRQLTFSPMK